MRLSPPFFLRDAAREWGGLSQDEIVAVLEKHFRDCRHLYIAGAGDQHFHLMRSEIARAIEAKYPSRRHVDEQVVRPPPRRPNGVRPIPHFGGVDVFDDRDDGGTGQEDDPVTDVERRSALPGYERTGVPIGAEDDGEEV